MSLMGSPEEHRIRRDHAIGSRLIKLFQGHAQLDYLIQLRRAGTAGQNTQFLTQFIQVVPRHRVLLPVTEHIAGIHDQVHAFGQEHTEQLRIGAPGLSDLFLFHMLEFLFAQLLDPLQQRLATGNGRIRVRHQVFEPLFDQLHKVVQQFKNIIRCGYPLQMTLFEEALRG